MEDHHLVTCSEGEDTPQRQENHRGTSCEDETKSGLDVEVHEQGEGVKEEDILDFNAIRTENGRDVGDISRDISDDVGQESVKSENMENRGPRLAPLGSLGGPRKALPPLQKLAPLGSMDRQGSLGSLDKPSLGSIDKPRSLESPKTLDKAPLGTLKKEGGGRQSSLESLGWKPPPGEGRRGSSASSLLSNSSLGKRGSFLKAKKEEEEMEDDDEEDEEEEEGSRVRGILKGSPLKEANDPKEGSR